MLLWFNVLMGRVVAIGAGSGDVDCSCCSGSWSWRSASFAIEYYGETPASRRQDAFRGAFVIVEGARAGPRVVDESHDDGIEGSSGLVVLHAPSRVFSRTTTLGKQQRWGGAQWR